MIKGPTFGGVVLSEVNPTTGINENDMSIFLLIKYGDFRYLIGGDIQDKTEEKIADRDLVLDVDVYQANHHGSDTSSTLAFIEDLSPSVIIISNGDDGRYKYPRKDTLDRFDGLNPKPTVFQTNKYSKGGDGGNVPDEYIGDLDCRGDEGTILVDVNKTTGTYEVSYRDKSHTFQIKDRNGTVTYDVVIESLLPDPVEPDREFEEVTLKNKGRSSVPMAGWILRDAGGRVWTLVNLGNIDSGESKTIRRNGMPMSLNNNGDEIFLIDSGNQIADRFFYTGSQKDMRIDTVH